MRSIFNVELPPRCLHDNCLGADPCFDALSAQIFNDGRIGAIVAQGSTVNLNVWNAHGLWELTIKVQRRGLEEGLALSATEARGDLRPIQLIWGCASLGLFRRASLTAVQACEPIDTPTKALATQEILLVIAIVLIYTRVSRFMRVVWPANSRRKLELNCSRNAISFVDFLQRFRKLNAEGSA